MSFAPGIGMKRQRPSLSLARWHGAAALLPLVIATNGCYQYVSASTNDLEAGRAVRLRLSAVAVDRLRQGPTEQADLLDNFEVSGTVGRVAGDSIVLNVPMPVMEANVRMRTALRDLALVRTDVQTVALRQLDRKRTTVVGVGAGIGAVAVVWTILHAAGATGGLPGSGGTNEIRIPLTLRLRIP